MPCAVVLQLTAAPLPASNQLEFLQKHNTSVVLTINTTDKDMVEEIKQERALIFKNQTQKGFGKEQK